MTMTRWLSGGLAAAALALGAAACGGDEDGGDSAEANSEAKKTEELTVYSGRDEELVAPLLERFEQETGIRIRARYGETAELASTIREEGDATPADVFFGQDAGALGALEQAGALAELPAATLEKVEPRFRSPGGRWVGTSGRVRVIAYDTRTVTEDELPDSVLDVTDEAWKGKVGWAPTNASLQTFVTALRKVEGEDRARNWLEGMEANDARAYESNGLVRDAIAAGDVELGLINHYYVAQARAEEGEGYPVGLHFPEGDVGSLINVAGTGVLAGSEDGAAARRLVDFLLSDASQRYFAKETKEYPVAGDARPDPSLPALEEIDQPEVTLNELGDLEGTLELIESSGVL